MRVFRSIVIASLLLTATSAPLIAQIEDDSELPGSTVGSDFYNNTYFAVGLNFSLLSGIGFSGRASFPFGLSTELSVGVITLSDDVFFSVGGEAQYSFTQGDVGRLYGLLGAGYYSQTCDEEEGNCFDDPARVGAGFGFEWFASRNVAFDISLPLIYYTNSGSFFPVPEGGFYYYFR